MFYLLAYLPNGTDQGHVNSQVGEKEGTPTALDVAAIAKEERTGLWGAA